GEGNFHDPDISCPCAGALVHVTARNPSCAGRHSDLISAPVIANRRAGGKAAVENIIAWFLRIVAARIAHAVVNGSVPVKVVIRIYSVPTTVMGLERVMSPANTSVRARNDHSFSSKPESPDIGRVRVNNARLDRRWSAGS